MDSGQEKRRWLYVIEPFETIFLSRSDEIRTLVSLSSFAITNIQGVARLAKLLRHPEEKIEEARRVEDLARSETETNFPVLHGAGIVLVWGALEAAIRDFMVRWISECDGILQGEPFAKLRVRVGEYEALAGEDRARYLLGVLEHDAGVTLKPGIARFESVLRPWGIIPDISEEDRRELIEISAVRNVIVHSAGVVDSRLKKACPWLSMKTGERVRVNSTTFQRYASVTGRYAAAIIESGEKVFAAAQRK